MTFSSLLSIRSHPVRVRGLKHYDNKNILSEHAVAPRAGAWIETVIVERLIKRRRSHPVRVRGLKQLK